MLIIFVLLAAVLLALALTAWSGRLDRKAPAFVAPAEGAAAFVAGH